MLSQCEDDENFIFSQYSNDRHPLLCAQLQLGDGYRGCEKPSTRDDNTGVAASAACPLSCRTGCSLTYNSCWDQQDTCLNGGVCTNIPRVTTGNNSFTCTCRAGFCTKNCATEDGQDHSDGNPNCPVNARCIIISLCPCVLVSLPLSLTRFLSPDIFL